MFGNHAKLPWFSADKRHQRIKAASHLEDLIVRNLRTKNWDSLRPNILTYKVLDGVLVFHYYS
ncbi:hypothetical protein [Vibrio aquimaris]|uniref:Uncharacterized protein n=1 Tax=Vibrio aquimaris TaxID=2587862 RepID=A0A5P9CNH8_9VIBR|nr:hypothetical protein [Vibrio aquimaris]QFT27521.1 hypothetical protein FIV01_14065 [Vibrio aquimaris]